MRDPRRTPWMEGQGGGGFLLTAIAVLLLPVHMCTIDACDTYAGNVARSGTAVGMKRSATFSDG